MISLVNLICLSVRPSVYLYNHLISVPSGRVLWFFQLISKPFIPSPRSPYISYQPKHRSKWSYAIELNQAYTVKLGSSSPPFDKRTTTITETQAVL